jgi:peptidoglycan LD-endopeptidase LytH
LPDSTAGFVLSFVITDERLQLQRLSRILPLLNMPDSNAAVKMPLQSGITIPLLGIYKNFFLTEWQNNPGWIQKPDAW